MYKLSMFNYYLDVSDDVLGVYNSNTSNFSLIPKLLFDGVYPLIQFTIL